MKRYKRQYERVFSGDKLVNKKCDLSEVTTHENAPAGVDEYIRLYRKTFDDMEKALFDGLVKMTWLAKRFTYRGYRRKRTSRNGWLLDRAYGVFVRAHLGYDNRFFSPSNGPSGKILTYFHDFFPDFDLGNPFEEPYKFPYKHLTLSHLVLVYQMEERLELLKEAEDKKMKYADFLDYVINYISCLNEERAEEKYKFIFSHMFMPYIKDMTRKQHAGTNAALKKLRGEI